MAKCNSTAASTAPSRFNIVEPLFDPPHGLTWNEWRHQYDVHYFVVCHDVVEEDGKRVFNSSLSPYFATLEAAEVALPALRARHPDAVIGGGTLFFRPLWPADMLDRAAFISLLQGVTHD